MITIVNAYEKVFPIVGAGVEGVALGDAVVIRQVYGTAFPIGMGCFLTAAHAIHAASENPWFGLAFADGEIWRASPLMDFKTIDDCDLSVVRAKLPKTRSLEWGLGELPMLHPVQVVGYPYSLDLQHFVIRIRAFAGHVVSNLTFYDLSANPRAYELSFPCPRGLSGSPLLDSNLHVAGLITGNKATQMLVFSNREILSEGQRQTIVERYESLQLGIAIQSDSLVGLESRILEGSLYDHLLRSGSVSGQRAA